MKQDDKKEFRTLALSVEEDATVSSRVRVGMFVRFLRSLFIEDQKRFGLEERDLKKQDLSFLM